MNTEDIAAFCSSVRDSRQFAADFTEKAHLLDEILILLRISQGDLFDNLPERVPVYGPKCAILKFDPTIPPMVLTDADLGAL